MMEKLFPALFIGHGSPINAIQNNDFTRSLSQVAAEFSKPKAILVISAHWITQGLQVTAASEPKQIYDFYGFSQQLYEIKYNCPGSVALANMIISSVKSDKVSASLNRGIDHAAWTILRHMYPDADIPVCELSIDLGMPVGKIREIAVELNQLRNSEILIIGSGNMVHNLRFMEPDQESPPYDWALAAENKIVKMIQESTDALFQTDSLDKEIRKGMPSPDHFLPMLFILGLKQPDDRIRFFYRGFQYASVAMTSFIIE